MSPSTNDSATHPSHPSLLKSAQLLANTGNLPGDETTATSQSKCSDGNTVSDTVSETVNKVKSSFLSQFACGVFAASSFAFCATGKITYETTFFFIFTILQKLSQYISVCHASRCTKHCLSRKQGDRGKCATKFHIQTAGRFS